MLGVYPDPTCNYPKEKPIYSINRLILIGNGFDLAHGYNTKYTDFLFHYLNEMINKFYLNNEFDDQLISIEYKGAEQLAGSRNIKNNINEVYDELMRIQNHRISVVRFKSKLLERILEKLGSNNDWVDIENEYYQLLKLSLKKRDENLTNNLNNDLDYLSEKLEAYLTMATSDNIMFRGRNYIDLFTEVIKKEEIVTINLEKSIIPDSLYLLNFNYTDTIFNYEDTSRKIKNVYHNFIHGELNKKENPIIFGFGDELDENYLEFEKENDNKLFRHIKSFKYFKTQNYHNLIRFIDSNYFQVYIIGHSCGLSDRTMLNQIFEHKNCASIKIFYHNKGNGKNDYTEKTYEISRHFKDKAMMRKKIIPEINSNPMPKPRRIK
ncbi:MAG: bacteriophage abortive infection AbiH family protein [Flavobacteriaceae bacterium]|nr:bacteriophage abortive infection AbiH family protein [Flavobacteriaceae bacterium]